MDRIIEIWQAKNADTSVAWYPFSDLYSHLTQLREVMGAEEFGRLFVEGAAVLDVGPADGDLSYYLESLGCKVDALDNPPTNYNSCNGIRKLKETLRSSVELRFHDVDVQFPLDRQYSVAIACGILYHLRNPMSFLIQLALHAEHLILSTRTATRLLDGTDISGSPLAYLLAHRESNNDPTNYWIFSPEGLKRCLARSGWLIRNTVVYGPEDGDPAEKDQRTFVYCQRVPDFAKLLPHHGV